MSLPSRTVVYTQTNMEELIVIQTELLEETVKFPPAPCVSGGLHEPTRDGVWFSSICGTCTAGTVQQK